jgi:DNA-binding MarR family transcriptional regulator
VKRIAERDALPIDSSLFFKLVRVVNLTARPFVETLSKTYQVSLNEWRVMVVLAAHPGISASELAEFTGLDKMSISRAVAALSRRARLTKKADRDDARRTQLRLNAAGLRLFGTIGRHAKLREAQLLGGVDPTELDQLNRTIDKLIGALSEAEQA